MRFYISVSECSCLYWRGGWDYCLCCYFHALDPKPSGSQEHHSSESWLTLEAMNFKGSNLESCI